MCSAKYPKVFVFGLIPLYSVKRLAFAISWYCIAI